jgi:hypothetical protein
MCGQKDGRLGLGMHAQEPKQREVCPAEYKRW